jgi:hypothetical protein
MSSVRRVIITYLISTCLVFLVFIVFYLDFLRSNWSRLSND